MKVKTDENKIVLKNLPLVPWLAGLVFSIGGLQVVLQSLLTGAGVSIFGVLFGLVFVFVGYQAGLSALYQRITIDRWLKRVTVRKIGLWSLENIEYSAADIEKFYTETETDSENSKSYTICLSLKGGQCVVLGTAFQSKAECESVIKTAQSFLEQISFPNQYQPKYL